MAEKSHHPKTSEDAGKPSETLAVLRDLDAKVKRIGAWIEPRRDVLDDEALAFLDYAARESGETRQDILLKSLTLFLKASEAERRGRTLAILDDDDVIVEEIRGIGSPLVGSVRPMDGISGLAS